MVALKPEAYERLKRLKRKGQTFSDVIMEYVRVPAETAGELLDWHESQPPPSGLNCERMDQALKDRRRRSKRDR